MVKYTAKNILESEEDVIVHGCNCLCTMGAGVAKQIAQQWPQAATADAATKYGDTMKLGTYSVAHGKTNSGKDVFIVNLYTQYAPSGPKFSPFNYMAFEIGLKKILQDFDGKTIAMPCIGAGLAGGNWYVIEDIINRVSGERIVYVYDIYRQHI
jgi:O-acetyl-ADP-ribose deacetylase (regulator of RNase III)